MGKVKSKKVIINNKGIVIPEALYVRSDAGKENESLTVIKKNTEVIILTTKKDNNGKDWYKIKIDNLIGYVDSSFIKKI